LGWLRKLVERIVTAPGWLWVEAYRRDFKNPGLSQDFTVVPRQIGRGSDDRGQVTNCERLLQSNQ